MLKKDERKKWRMGEKNHKSGTKKKLRGGNRSSKKREGGVKDVET